MRTSQFISPKHYSKVCDIAAESVVQLYTNSNELYYSDVFSYIVNDELYVNGWISSNNHFSHDIIKQFISDCIEIDINIVLSIKQISLSNNISEINTGTFLGYATNENSEGIPFEHLLVTKLTKSIYNKINEAIKIGLVINGKQIDIFVETNYKNNSDIIDLINEYLIDENYISININISPIINQLLYKSNENFIINAYGPRSPYGNTNFIGLDIYRNSKYSHLVSKEIAGRIGLIENLNYSLVELTYSHNNPTPIQFGIKGNIGGIHLENGTFFENCNKFGELIDIKNNFIEKIKSTQNSLIELAKWGYFNLNTKYEKL
jgi:S-adenosylmethionine synthetase